MRSVVDPYIAGSSFDMIFSFMAFSPPQACGIAMTTRIREAKVTRVASLYLSSVASALLR